MLVTGMGGDLGSRVAAYLEQEDWVGDLLGIDADPPRRRLQRANFHLASTSEHERIVQLVTDYDPHVVIHLSIWEPFSRASPKQAKALTQQAATTFLGAIAECRSLESIVVRSGIEVYGRARGAPTRPDESADINPTCDFGRSLAEIEHTAGDIGRRIGVPVGAVRLGGVIGPHVPSPLGRLLRMPVVPFSVLADPPFAVVEDIDAARGLVAAARRQIAQPVNVLANGAITMLQALRRGGRVPFPLIGPDWRIARLLAHLAGAPIPDHVQETLHRGRLADNGRMQELLGFTVSGSTVDVIDKLYAWPSVVHIPAKRQVA